MTALESRESPTDVTNVMAHAAFAHALGGLRSDFEQPGRTGFAVEDYSLPRLAMAPVELVTNPATLPVASAPAPHRPEPEGTTVTAHASPGLTQNLDVFLSSLLDDPFGQASPDRVTVLVNPLDVNHRSEPPALGSEPGGGSGGGHAGDVGG